MRDGPEWIGYAFENADHVFPIRIWFQFNGNDKYLVVYDESSHDLMDDIYDLNQLARQDFVFYDSIEDFKADRPIQLEEIIKYIEGE